MRFKPAASLYLHRNGHFGHHAMQSWLIALVFRGKSIVGPDISFKADGSAVAQFQRQIPLAGTRTSG
jgi:hypothetical protein